MGKNKRKSTAIQLISRMCLKSWKGREKKRKKQKVRSVTESVFIFHCLVLKKERKVQGYLFVLVLILKKRGEKKTPVNKENK